MEMITGMDSPIGKSKLSLSLGGGGGGGGGRRGGHAALPVNWTRSSFTAEPVIRDAVLS